MSASLCSTQRRASPAVAGAQHERMEALGAKLARPLVDEALDAAGQRERQHEHEWSGKLEQAPLVEPAPQRRQRICGEEIGDEAVIARVAQID